MEEKKDNTPEGCIQDCSACPSSIICESSDEDGPSFFDRLEAISERFETIGEENIIDMLNEAVSELEKEDAEEKE